MTFGELLLLVFLACIAYLFLKISISVLILAMILIVLYYLSTLPYKLFYNTPHTVEGYYSESPMYSEYMNLNRKPFLDEDYHMGYGNYWYIPVQNYLDDSINLDNDVNTVPGFCQVPTSTSEYCVNQRIIETNGNLNEAIALCTVPPKVGPQCVEANEYLTNMVLQNKIIRQSQL